MILRRRNAVRGERSVHRYGERDPGREARVSETDRRRAADAREEQRADAEERGGQKRTRRVVDAEGAGVPLGGLAPGDRRRGDRIGGERLGPGRELEAPRRPVAAGERAGEAKRDERGREGEQGVHVRRE